MCNAFADLTKEIPTVIKLRKEIKQLKKLEKGAKKIKEWFEKGYLKHSLFCNFQHSDCKFCNCGIADIIQALKGEA